MDHDGIQQLLPAYVDGELGLVQALAVERHLATCLACRREIEAQRDASRRMRAATLSVDAPAALRARLDAALHAAAEPTARSATTAATTAATNAALPPAQAPRARLRPRLPAWRGWWPQTLAAVAVLVALAWGATAYRPVLSPQQALTEELVANHVRSLQVDHLADVASSDQHTVKPWFIGKLNFAPPVVDLAPQGFPLIGGRLDYLGGRDVAVLVYRHKHHPINLTVWPGADLPARPQAMRWHGYHLVRWSDGAMDYAAVSDVAEGDLAQFVGAVRAQAVH